MMKTKTTFTTEFLNELDQLIFITELNNGFEKQWEVLTDDEGKHFTDLDKAIEFVRFKRFTMVGLSTLDQAKMSNAQWDNF